MTAPAIGAATFRGQAPCESCGCRPASRTVSLADVEPFAVCDDCAPASTGVRAATDDVDNSVPPLDWAGELCIRQPWTEVARVIAGILAPGLLGLLAFHIGDGTDAAFLAMVTVGVVTAALSIWLDSRLLGLPARWGLRRIR